MTGRDGGQEKARQHEAMAQEERHWVRLTRACNNRCAFCLDDLTREGTVVPDDEVLADIQRGRQRGAQRLILSGGEPTIHPRFVHFIARGRRAGYSHIQVVTNGRMFSYRRLLERAIRAGLDEVTFSVHGPDDATHDALVGVSGALAQTEAALKAALASGRLIVSVDVCLNRKNIGRLDEILERCLAMGVREFDLLQIIPFGRAFGEGNLDDLAYDMEAARPQLQRALEVAARPGVHVWFNRFPPPYLEGHEHLIQDPHKLHDEVRGRQEELEELLTQGKPLRCRAPQRCTHCYLQPLCDALEALLDQLGRRTPETYRVRPGPGPEFAVPPPPWPMRRLWVRAPDLEAAGRVVARVPCREVILELDRYRGLGPWIASRYALGARTLVQARAGSVDSLRDLMATPGDFEVVATLTREVARYLLREVLDPPARLVLTRRNHGRAEASAEQDADLKAFFQAYPGVGAVEGIVRCISGQAPRLVEGGVLDAEVLRRPLALDHRGAPVVDLRGFTSAFIRETFRSKSLRCRACRWDETCGGEQLNYLRAHGYRTLSPVSREA